MAADATKDTLIERRVLLGTASNYIGKIISLAVLFFIAPFILYHLGPVTFGLWALVGSVVEYGSLLDLGISTGLIKYVAEYRARGELQQINGLIATALRLYSVLGLVAIAIAALAAPIFPLVFRVPASARTTAVWLVLLVGINLGISLPCSVTTGVLRGLHRFDLSNALTIVATIISTSATIIVLVAGRGVLGMVVSGTAVTVLMLGPSIWLVRRAVTGITVGWRGASRQQARTLLSYSSWQFVIQVGARVKTRTDALVIGAFLPIANVTPYAFALRLCQVPQILTEQFLKVMLPLASALHAENDETRLRALYVTSARLSLVILAPVGVLLILLAQPILEAWIGVSYGSYAYLILILALAIMVETSFWPASSVLQGMARQQPLAIAAVVSAAVNLLLSIVLVQRFGMGGVAMGTLIPNILEAVLFVFPYTMRVLGVSIGALIRDIFAPTLLPLVPMAAFVVGARRLAPLSGAPVIVAVLAAGMLTYLSGYFLFGAKDYERAAFRRLFQGAAGSVRMRLRSN